MQGAAFAGICKAPARKLLERSFLDLQELFGKEGESIRIFGQKSKQPYGFSPCPTVDPRNLKRLDSTRRFKFHPLFGREGEAPGSATRQKPDHLVGERFGDPDDSLHFPSASEGVEDLCSTTCITSKTGVGIVDPPRLDRGGPILGAQFLTRMGCVERLEFPVKNADAPSSFSRKVLGDS